MENKICRCGREIHPLRLKVIPDTQICEVCVKSKDVERVGGIQVITGKTTYSEIQVVPLSQAKIVAHMQNREGSIVGNAVRGRKAPKHL